jgi:hypothetical protein
MSSSTSPSPAPSDLPSSSIRGLFTQGDGGNSPFGGRSWPIGVFFPILLAILMVSAIAPFMYLFLGERFGLTGGRPAPWPWGFAFVGLIGFWGTRLVQRLHVSSRVYPVLQVALWLLSLILWFAVQPNYDVRDVMTDPVSLVKGNGYFLTPIFISMFAWWQGSRYAADSGRFAPEEIRGLVQRCWLILTLSIIFAAMIGGEAGHSAINAAKLAVPLCMLASIALVAGTEVEATRQLARRRGAHVPSWKRWYRLVGGFAVAIIVVSLIVTVLLGPGAMRALLDAIIFGFRSIAWLLGYVLYALVYVLYIVIRAVAALLELIFGSMFGPIKTPEMKTIAPVGPPQAIEQSQPDTWEYAVLLRWIAIGIALLIVGIIVFRFSRRKVETEGDGIVEEERDSVFNADLAKKQLRDFFRRRHGPAAPERLDFDRPPATVREAMIYLEVLANREGVARRSDETPADFAMRLRGIWQGTAGAVADLIGAYQRVRYGESDDPPNGQQSVVTASAWSQIWRRRKAVAEDSVGNRNGQRDDQRDERPKPRSRD